MSKTFDALKPYLDRAMALKAAMALFEWDNETLAPKEAGRLTSKGIGILSGGDFCGGNQDKGEELAKVLQEELIRVVKPKKERQGKANDSYYMLKRTSAPICIVECGFLSNWEESRLLQDENYQEKLAWAIHLGILKYLNQ